MRKLKKNNRIEEILVSNSSLVSGLSEASGGKFSWVEVSQESLTNSKRIWENRPVEGTRAVASAGTGALVTSTPGEVRRRPGGHGDAGPAQAPGADGVSRPPPAPALSRGPPRRSARTISC